MAINRKALSDVRVAVLCGGPGAEREVSLISGEAVFQGLLQAGLDAKKVEIAGTEAELDRLSCDVAFLALHGEFGEDGQVQRMLEKRGVLYTGCDADVSAVSMDKDLSKKVLRKAGIPTAGWVVLDKPDGAADVLKKAGLALPVVVKPVSRGSSVGTTIVRSAAELEPAVEKALAFDTRVMAETFIAGRELTVGMLGGEILPVVELRPRSEFYDYQAKYIADDTEYLCPAPLTEEETRLVQSTAADVIRHLGVRDMGRVDILLGEMGPMVLEVNTIPGFTSHSLLPMAAKAAGFPFPALCKKIVELALARDARPIRA